MKHRKILSLLLSLAMIIGCIPASVLADDSVEIGTPEEIQESEEPVGVEDEYNADQEETGAPAVSDDESGEFSGEDDEDEIEDIAAENVVYSDPVTDKTFVEVKTWTALDNALDNYDNIKLGDDITAARFILIPHNGRDITIDLNGHTLSRGCTEATFNGFLLYVSGKLTVIDSVGTGVLTGAYNTSASDTSTADAENGGCIIVRRGAELTLENVNISGNRVSKNDKGRGGAICNWGTLTINGGIISNNSGDGAGGIYNGAGAVAELTGVTVSNNTSDNHGGGGIDNYGTLSLKNTTITGNSCNGTGGGVWSNGIVNVEGKVVISGNTSTKNSKGIFLKGSSKITLTGRLSNDSDIVVSGEGFSRIITSGWSGAGDGSRASVISFDQLLKTKSKGNELYVTAMYNDRSWDDTEKKIVSVAREIPEDARAFSTNLTSGWYLVAEEFTFSSRIEVATGSTVHLVLADGVTVNCQQGIHVPSSAALYIHGVYDDSCTDAEYSERGDSGLLRANAEDVTYCAGIGSNDFDADNENDVCCGTIGIFGGHIIAHGGKYAAGIGGGNESGTKSVAFYGGKVEATGGRFGPGIGSGDEFIHFEYGDVDIYGGLITATGGDEAAGIGGGNETTGGTILIEGGTINATGGDYGAGIGGGDDCGVYRIIINGGTINAHGGDLGAGIGDGFEEYPEYTNDLIRINGGTIVAQGGDCGAGIGGASVSDTDFLIAITGGHITARGGMHSDSGSHSTRNDSGACGIGASSRYHADTDFKGKITISGGTVIAESSGRTVDRGGAAIGAGYQGEMEGTIEISGGYVKATGRYGGAAIGAGAESGTDGGECRGTIRITGGTVELYVEYNLDESAPALIGYGENGDEVGTLRLSGQMCVKRNSSAAPVNSGSRVSTLQSNNFSNETVIVSTCTHPSGYTYTANGDDTHTAHCRHCATVFEAEAHDYDDHGQCTVCGYNYAGELYDIVFAANGGSGSMTTISIIPGNSYVLPENGFTPPIGGEFLGWKVDNILRYPGYEFEPSGNTTITAEWKIFEDGVGARLAGYALSLDGDIGVLFYMELSDEVSGSDDAYMQFELPNGDTPKVYVRDVRHNTRIVDGNTYYVFRCNVAAKEMTQQITAHMVCGSKTGTQYTFTVRQYAEYILEHDDIPRFYGASDLVRALLNYGAYAQLYFGVNTGDLANRGVAYTRSELDNVSFVDPGFTNCISSENVTFVGATLSLKSETTLSLYFKTNDGSTLRFRCDHGKTVEYDSYGGYQIARIRGIRSNEIGQLFTVFVEDAGSVTYSPLTYCDRIINGQYNADLKDVCRALVLYYQAAAGYIP